MDWCARIVQVRRVDPHYFNQPVHTQSLLQVSCQTAFQDRLELQRYLLSR